ncbi:Hypothetical_protein [Hexamita inflata]|uniref:Hypothetical_protein n=1 Tax=Hexamita inflata TaxID=28002 RepID=A0AA86PJ66_9EUKA|nr:Hypothetical protein HINF_LOCUS26937 [Hexamita inflata]
MDFKKLKFSIPVKGVEEISNLETLCNQYRTQLVARCHKMSANTIIDISNLVSRMSNSDQNIFESAFGSTQDIQQKLVHDVLHLQDLDCLIFDESTITNNSVEKLVQILKPGVQATSAFYNIKQNLSESSLKASLQFDATYLNEYVYKKKNGNYSGATQVKPNYKKEVRRRTTIIICILEEYSNINGFALSTNVVECYNGILKKNVFINKQLKLCEALLNVISQKKHANILLLMSRSFQNNVLNTPEYSLETTLQLCHKNKIFLNKLKFFMMQFLIKSARHLNFRCLNKLSKTSIQNTNL